MEDVIKKVEEIVRENLSNDDIVLSEDTVSDDIAGWDSLNHVQIIGEIQREYGIKFSSREMLSWDNVGQMCETINKKKG